jgi:hypothetical protein
LRKETPQRWNKNIPSKQRRGNQTLLIFVSLTLVRVASCHYYTDPHRNIRGTIA